MNDQITFFVAQQQKEIETLENRRNALVVQAHPILVEITNLDGQIAAMRKAVSFLSTPIPVPAEIPEQSAPIEEISLPPTQLPEDTKAIEKKVIEAIAQNGSSPPVRAKNGHKRR